MLSILEERWTRVKDLGRGRESTGEERAGASPAAAAGRERGWELGSVVEEVGGTAASVLLAPPAAPLVDVAVDVALGDGSAEPSPESRLTFADAGICRQKIHLIQQRRHHCRQSSPNKPCSLPQQGGFILATW